MTTKTLVHNVTTVKADRIGTTTWLEISTKDDNQIVVFMEWHEAEALAEAWAEAQEYEPDPPTYDEALGRKCDAEARMDEARKLKGM